jgi:hypothetical protein
MIEEMHAVLGSPSRIDSGITPAPHGHRNNQIHVYDSFGFVVHEHHFTRRAEDIWCWFDVQEPQFAFVPYQPFVGRLLFDGVEMPLGGRDVEFVRSSPFKFAQELGHVWRYEFAGFVIMLNSQGRKLDSGRRSSVCQITDLSISWPHDNRLAPVASAFTPP